MQLHVSDGRGAAGIGVFPAHAIPSLVWRVRPVYACVGAHPFTVEN